MSDERYTVLGLSTKYYDPDDASSGIDYYIISHENMTPDELREMVSQKYPGSHCTHSYDCCGHTYGENGRLLFSNEDTALVGQRWYVNI
jgi:hypothetical protein